MFGRGAAEVHDGAEAAPIAPDERLGIEPEPREGDRTVEAVLAERSLDQGFPPSYEPEDLVRFQRANHIFPNTRPLVVLELWTQVDVSGGVGDLGEQLGRPMEQILPDAGPAAELGEDAKQ